MTLAHDIQLGMLARRVPELAEVDLGAQLRPARTVGGDLYDIVRTGDDLWFIVGDVAGQGVAAALLMAVAQTLFRAIAPSGLSLPDVLARMNRELCRDNDRSMFVTAFAGSLDLLSGRLRLANAGHNLPFWMDRDGGAREVAVPNGLALGVLEDSTFPITEFRLEPGDGLVLYTDGVCDAVDPQGDAFGTPGIERALVGHLSKTAPRLVQDIFEAVDAFAGSAPQEDDITVLALRYRGPGT
jgi:sigma-B regulation protein RsbU (phosphoserine phosphatase)